MPKLEVREDNPPSLEEAQKFVGGLVQMITLNNGDQLLMNEEGKLDDLPFNDEATKLWEHSFGKTDVIVGDALLLKGKARWE